MSGSYANPFTWEQVKKGPFCDCWRFRFIPRPSPACAAQTSQIGAAAFHNQPARGRWAAEAEADPDGDGDEAGAPPPTSSSLKRCGGRARSSAERGTVGRTPPPLRADGDDRGGPDAATTGAQRCGGQARSSAERWGGRRLSYARAATIGETRTWRRRGRWSDPLPGEGGGGP